MGFILRVGNSSWIGTHLTLKRSIKASTSICRFCTSAIVILATATIFSFVALVIEFIDTVTTIISSDELHISG